MTLTLRKLALLTALALAANGCSGGDDDDDDGPTVPVINSVAPSSGIVGAEVTVTGSRFGDEQGTSTITFGSIAAGVTSWTDTEIVATVPPDAYPGPRAVEVTVDGDASSPFAFSVVLPDAVYANNNVSPTSSSVTAFTGASFAGTAYVVGTAGSSSYSGDSSAIFVHAGSRRVFSTHTGFIAVYDVDPVSGLLTEVAGSPFDTGLESLYGVEVNDDGTVVYAAECGAEDAVVAMAIDANGALAHLPGSPYMLTGFSDCVDVVRLTPDESFLVASVETSLSVRVFSVGVTGALTEVGGSPFTFANGGGDYGFDMHPYRNAFYMPSEATGALYVYSITSGTGAPVLLDSAGSGQQSASSFAFSDDGNRLYTLLSGSDSLSVYDVDGTGAVTLLSSAFTLTATANAIEVDGTTLWAGGTDGLLYRHTLAGTGEPSASGTPIANPGAGSGKINALAVP